MYFLSLMLAATMHPNTGQPVHSFPCAPTQAAHHGPDQAPTGVNNKTPMTPASTGSGQQTQLRAVANAHWKPNTHLHFKPHFSFCILKSPSKQDSGFSLDEHTDCQDMVNTTVTKDRPLLRLPPSAN